MVRELRSFRGGLYWVGLGIMRKVMIKWLFSFILLALGAFASLAVSVAGDIVHNFMSY
jgi:hypothetical protein